LARYIGNYEVVHELGSGHFGTVYLAVGEVPGRGRVSGKRRIVAVKKLRDSADRESTELLLQEFALLDEVKHRGIVRVFEYLGDENAVVMEYIHGVTLRDVLDELGKAREQVFTEAAIEIGCELADALYQAFTTPSDNGEPLQLVHRDLKPENVMLTAAGEVKVLDFGLARVDNTDFKRERDDRIKGTPLYMAPEQARGLEVDHRTDLFALGLILYELLMNRPAYKVGQKSRSTVSGVMAAIEAGDLGEELEELEGLLPGVGPIITRLLQRRPKDRYQHGHDMLVDLRRQLYRDRGAYLEEFCEFFFGTIHDIGDPPRIEDLKAKGRSVASAAPGGRKTIEQRLKESMAREKKASKSTTSRVAPPGNRRSPPPPPSGAPMSSSGRKPPPRPPVGGGAAPRVTRPKAKGRKSAADIGQRRPDETGMLNMVPLSDDDDANEAAGDPSATQFFAIPAPKAERAKPAAPPPSMASPPSSGGMGGPPPPMARGGMGQPPPAARPGPMIQGPTPGAGVAQGPVAGYGGGGGGGGGTPFHVQGPAPGAPPADAGQRVQSNRVYAIVFGVFLLVCLAVFVAIWLRPAITGEVTADAGSGSENGAVVVDKTVKKKKQLSTEDTGEPEVEPQPKVKKKKKKYTGSGSGTTTTKVAAAPSGPAPLNIKLNGGGANAFEVTCPSGFRQRTALSGSGSGTLAGVPQESCTLFFKGGSPAKYGPVSGGKSLNCQIVGTTANCK